MAQDVDRLKAIPLFDSLKRAELEYVGSILREGFCPVGQTVFAQGDPSDKFYIVVDGQVGVFREYGPHVRVGISTLKKHDFFGETGLLTDEPRDITIEAMSDTTYFYIEKEQFAEMLERLPAVEAKLQTTETHRSSTGMAVRIPDKLNSDEVPLWTARHDLVPLVAESLFWLLVGNGLAIGLAALAFYGASTWSERWPAAPWALGAMSVVVFAVVWAWHIVDWTNDYLALTNRRIIYHAVFGFLRERRQEIPIEAVQDVSLLTRGPIFKLLGLSDITIQTISGKLKFEHLRDAEDLQDRILGRRDMYRLEARGVEHGAMSKELRQALDLASSPRKSAWDILPAVTRPPTLFERVRASPKMRLEKTSEITWRRHWLFLAKRMVGPLILFLVGLAVLVLVELLLAPAISLPVLGLADLVIVAIPTALWTWWEYAVWGGDIYTLTDDRLIDIERLPLGLRAKRRETQLDRVQDIDVDVPNLLARLLDMGDVKIKTGAAGSDLTFLGVADPYGVQRDIFHRLAKLRRKRDEQSRRQRYQEMITWLTVYHKVTNPKASQAGAPEVETSS